MRQANAMLAHENLLNFPRLGARQRQRQSHRRHHRHQHSNNSRCCHQMYMCTCVCGRLLSAVLHFASLNSALVFGRATRSLIADRFTIILAYTISLLVAYFCCYWFRCVCFCSCCYYCWCGCRTPSIFVLVSLSMLMLLLLRFCYNYIV